MTVIKSVEIHDIDEYEECVEEGLFEWDVSE